MNLNNKKGSVLLETVITLPIVFIFIFFLLELSMVSVARSMVQWSCFEIARSLMTPPQTDSKAHQSSIEKAKLFLNQIPFKSSPPHIETGIFENHIQVQIRQPLCILGMCYDLKNKTAIHK